VDDKKRQLGLACLCNSCYKGLMPKQIYKQKGRTAVNSIVHENSIETGLHLATDTIFALSAAHPPNSQSVRDLPIFGKKTILHVDAFQSLCPAFRRFHTLRPPPVCHPVLGYTWRFMRPCSACSFRLPLASLKMSSICHALPPSALTGKH